MSKLSVCLAMTMTIVVGTVVFPVRAEEPKPAWQDNDRQFKSDDPKVNVRRSEHFRILWGKGAGKQKEENADFAKVTEPLVQGNLQMLEQVWHRYHDPEPRGMGFHVGGNSCNPKFQDAKFYRANLVMNNTGIWAGGAWGACDEWGFPLFALPPTYLRFDPPSGATPHEFAHTVIINAGGFNETPYDGMWHEATVNWFMLQFNNSYPGPAAVGTQPFLSVPHGRNYYDSWQLWEYFREEPRYGYPFINKVWTEARGNKAKGGEYIFDAMARLDTSGSPDATNAIKDALGRMAARNVMWDYERQAYFQKQSPRTRDPMSEMYRRAYTELVRRQGDTTWFRVPFAHAPMQGGYNVVPIALEGKTGGGYAVTVDFRPLWDATRRSDWRVTLVAVNDNGESRYSTMWNQGRNSIALSADENQLYLAVAATPDFMPFEGFSHPLISDLPLQPQAYEVAYVDTKATAWESKPARPEKAPGKAHPTGGGFVADTATVDITAYVGPNAMVLGKAKVLGTARIEDYAVVAGEAVVKDKACVSGHAVVRDKAQVYDNAKVRDWATVQGAWQVCEYGRALERAWLSDKGELHGHATIKGAVIDFGGADVKGYAIKDGDCANTAKVDRQVLLGWAWGIDQKYADGRPDTGGVYCRYDFARPSPIYALDHFGVMHGYLVGSPRLVALNDAACPGVLELNGKDQYVELKRDVADFGDTTLAVWVNWAGGAADQRIVHFGDGAKKYAYLTPKDAAGKVRFAITTAGAAGEQTLVGPVALPVGIWTHVAITLKGESGTLYVDGKPVATNGKMTLRPDAVLGPNTLAGNDCTFLGRGDQGGWFKGFLTDFRVYVEPQEATVIEALAAEIKSRNASVVVEAPAAGQLKTPAPGFLMNPIAEGETAAVMSAARIAGAPTGVEYAFTCTSGGGHASGWISGNRWTDCRLEPGKTYAYTYKTRDGRGREAPPCEPATVALPKAVAAPAVEFEVGPTGLSASAVRMTAKRARNATSLVEYQFTRGDGKASGWQSSPTWADTGLTEGETYSYAIRARDAWGNASPASAARSAVARDDTPPARYRIGEWQTLPYATVDNRVAMRAMSVTGEEGCPKIEPEPVEYSFHCVEGKGPDSGWIAAPSWQTPALADGTYRYQFKIRDTSPQHNETPYSSTEAAVVSPMTGYHDLALRKAAGEAEGTLVAFTGKVTAVAADSYTVASDGAEVKVMPQTVAGATSADLKEKDVAVRGCVWIVSGEKRIVWAEVK